MWLVAIIQDNYDADLYQFHHHRKSYWMAASRVCPHLCWESIPVLSRGIYGYSEIKIKLNPAFLNQTEDPSHLDHPPCFPLALLSSH